MRMIGPSLRFAVFGYIALLAGCSSAPTEINTASNPHTTPASYRTYAWAPEVANTPGEGPAATLDTSVKSDVEKQLTAKGMTKVPVDQAELLLSYTAISEKDVTYGAPVSYWSGYLAQKPYPTKKGTLTLQFIDPETRVMVWRGTATNTVGDTDANPKQLAESVQKLIATYPTA